MEKLKDDVIDLLTSNFGEETAKFAERFYDEKHPEKLVEVAENMMTKLVGPENAKKQLQQIYRKYSNIIKGGKHAK